MPTKRDSERAAGFYAVKKLHELNELDHRFLMAEDVDSDSEDMKKEKKNKTAGTDKRARLYANTVSDRVLCKWWKCIMEYS